MRACAAVAVGVCLSLPSLASAATCPIHADDPNLLAVLAQPVPTTNTIPETWVEVGDRYLSAQGHFSTAFGKMRHTHLEFPKAIFYCELTGPITFPFRAVLFQTDGSFTGIYGENVANVVWDDPLVQATQTFAGNPADGGVVIKTGRITIDPRPHPVRWWDAYAAPPHGWYEELINFTTSYTEGAGEYTQVFIPFYSMLDPTVAPTVPYDTRYPRQTDPWRGVQVFNTPTGKTPLGDETNWGTNSVTVRNMLPTFGTLIGPYTLPNTVDESTYGGGAFEVGGLTNDFRIGQNLHLGIPGTILYSTVGTICCNTALRVTFDPLQLGNGDVKPTFNWNQTGGPSLPQFPTRRTVSTLLTDGVNTDTTVAPPTVPPPSSPPPVPQPPPHHIH